MSLKIIRQGVLDTVQDLGRYGFQYLGINCNGAMDRFSMQLANALLGKELNSPVLELHFPSSQILFEKEAIICLTGADFSPTINGEPIPLHHPILISKRTLLQFDRVESGARCYLSVRNELKIDKWMNSYSTNLKSATGGFQGRRLLKHDIIPFCDGLGFSALLHEKSYLVFPWKAYDVVDTRNEIEFLIGSEWNWLTKDAQDMFVENWFQITNEADRMGYQLAGQPLEAKNHQQLVSS
ncbi:MAG: 5-oxoprolinase subunit C family protein, partial [Flavisolibacter sp.]